MATKLSSVRDDLRAAESAVREALSYPSPVERNRALMALHSRTPAGQLDTLFAVVAAHLTLVPLAATGEAA